MKQIILIVALASPGYWHALHSTTLQARIDALEQRVREFDKIITTSDEKGGEAIVLHDISWGGGAGLTIVSDNAFGDRAGHTTVELLDPPKVKGSSTIEQK